MTETPHHQLYLLHCGWLTNEDDHRVQVLAYLILASSGRRYLVDAGNPRQFLDTGLHEPYWYEGKVEITLEDDPIARLAELNLSPGDIDAVIATHLDFDHAGRLDAFAPHGTDVYIQRAQMAAALTGNDRYVPKLWNLPGLRYRLVDGDVDLEPGITLLRTDGHVHGHQSLLVDLESGPILVAADAIEDAALVDAPGREGPWEDAEAGIASLQRLMDIASRTNAFVIYGHDPAQWSTLPMSPFPFTPPQPVGEPF